MKTVWVVSHAVWHGGEQTSGGFWWFPDRDSAVMWYAQEKLAWKRESARIRLVRVDLPPEAEQPCRPDCPMCKSADTITCWLDLNIDGLEIDWAAEKVTLLVQ